MEFQNDTAVPTYAVGCSTGKQSSSAWSETLWYWQYAIDSSRNEQTCLCGICTGLHNNRREMAKEMQTWVEISEQIKWPIMLLTPVASCKWNSLLFDLKLR